jgi:hypothetical protein
MKHVFLGIVATFIVSAVNAQNSKTITLYPDISVNEQLADSVQYLFPCFNDGVVLTKSDGLIKAKLNYNLLLGEMHFLTKENKALSIANPQNIIGVDISSKSFIFKKDSYYEIIRKGLVNLIVKNNLNILSKGNKVAYDQNSQTSAVDNINTLNTSRFSFFVRYPQDVQISRAKNFYLSSEQNLIKIINRKSFEKVFKKKIKNIREYDEQFHPNYLCEEDLAKMYDYINAVQ